MTKFIANLIGEDNTEFSYEIEAPTRVVARRILDDIYPEAKCIGLYSASDIRQIENMRYRRLMNEMDNDYYFG
jgi:hypothetical protein